MFQDLKVILSLKLAWATKALSIITIVVVVENPSWSPGKEVRSRSLERWFSGSAFASKHDDLVQAPGPTQQKRKTNPYRLPSDLHTRTTDENP